MKRRLNKNCRIMSYFKIFGYEYLHYLFSFVYDRMVELRTRLLYVIRIHLYIFICCSDNLGFS